MKHLERRKARILASLVSFIICAILMGLAFYIAYQQTFNKASRLLQGVSEHTRLKIESFIKPLDKTLEKMEVLTNQCTEKTQQTLQRITFNDPSISLAFVSKNNDGCSNVGKHPIPINFVSSTDSLLLTGPNTLKEFNKPAFILSRQQGQYRYGLVLTQDTIKQLLPDNLKTYLFTSLVTLPDKKQFIHTGAYSSPLIIRPNLHGVQLSNTFRDKVSRLNITLDLPLFDNVYMLTALSTTWIWAQLSLHIYSIITIGLLFCMLAVYLIYVFTKRKLSLKAAMASALRDGEFLPHYQPVINLQQKSIAGVECLLRWKPENEPLIFPDHFIPTAEESGLIKPITTMLIEQIFEELGNYLATHPDFHVAINLTPQHFEDDHVLVHTKTLCEKHNVKTTQVIFELTEQKLLEEDNTEAVALMMEMHKQGFSLALDDFGTGYSSMNYLQRFPFDYLKIDRQFVIAIGSGAITEGLAESMIAMAKRLELKIIAEGIENTLQADYLTQFKVEYAQGWLYSKALPIETLLLFIESFKKPS
jgi:sensor c-di-GMP phosphodiesterase-like protein